MIRSAVLIQYTRVTVTDGQTDGIGVAYTRYSMLSRVKMMTKITKRKVDISLQPHIRVQEEDNKLSYCWETVRRESMPRIAEMDVEMTT